MNKFSEFINELVTIYYMTPEGERDYETGILRKAKETKGNTFFQLDYVDQEAQRANGISFSVSNFEIVEGDV